MTPEERGKKYIQNFLGEPVPNTTESSEYSINLMEQKTVQLCEKLNSVSFSPKDWLKDVSSFVADSSNRLLYSSITNFVFSMDQHDRISSNIKEAANYALNSQQVDSTLIVRKTVLKIYDHINLAIRQKALSEKEKDDLTDQIESIALPEIDRKSAELTREITGQLVGLIAVFTALSFIIFGGISSLDSIFQSLQATMDKKSTILPTLIVTISWAICLMNLLFGFMYFVLRITRLTTEPKVIGKNIVQRSPVVFLSNYIMFLFLTLFGGMWFAERNGIGKDIFNFCIREESITFWVAIFIFIVIFVGLAIWGIILYRQKACNS